MQGGIWSKMLLQFECKVSMHFIGKFVSISSGEKGRWDMGEERWLQLWHLRPRGKRKILNRDLGSCVIVIGDVTIYFVSPRIPVKVPHYTYLLLKLEASYFLNTMTFRNKP